MKPSTGPEQPPAWTSGETRRAWHKSALWGAAWAVLGLAMLASFVIYADRVAARSDSLISHGIQVNATVLENPPLSFRCAQVQVPVRFSLDGIVRTEPFSVDGCGNSLRRGKQITLYVDPADPTSFVSDQTEKEGGLAVLAACIGLVAGTV